MKMSYVGKIVSLDPIEKADNLLSATAVCGEGGKWTGVVKKTEFSLGDLCTVFLPDALLPETAEFEFMRARKFRVTQCRFRGAKSECLIFPLTIHTPGGFKIGDGMDAFYGVFKYEKPIDPSVGGDIAGNFPSFIPKTDEPNFQGVPNMVMALLGKTFYVTEKADGSSGTAYKMDGQLHLCTRNYESKDTPKSAGWTLARKYNLEAAIPEGMAIQFEMIGSKIQGNPMGVPSLDMRVFNVYNIEIRRYVDYPLMAKFCSERKLPMVKVVGEGEEFTPEYLVSFQEMAKGNYDNGKPREGIVIRPMVDTIFNGDRLSFKVINLEYGK